MAALSIGATVGFHYSIPFGSFFIAAASVIVIGFAIFIALKLVTATRREVPLDLISFAGFAAAVLLIALQWAVIMWLKVMLPLSVGFWADPALANVDHALFQAEPWRVANAVFGWATPAMDRIYASWAPVKFAILCGVVLAPQSQLKTRALISYFLFGAACSFLQYALPSAGPVFFAALGHGDRFSALQVQPWVETARDYLWRDYLEAGGHIGSGISAMPSVHVAAGLWIALVVRAYFPRLQLLGFAYFGAIFIGSVLLGWHYAVDGIASCAITMAAWQVAAWHIAAKRNPRGQREDSGIEEYA